MHYLGLVSILLFCAAATLSEIIDNFEVRHFNNLGGIRYGVGNVQLNVTYPRHGIVIPGKNDYLIEELSPERDTHSHMYLIIHYTAFQSGSRTIVLMYKYEDENKVPQRAKSGLVVSLQDDHHLFKVPLGRFTMKNYGYWSRFLAIGIGGPLIVHRLELVAWSKVTDMAISYSSVKNFDSFVKLNFDPTLLRRNPSPPQQQFEEYDPFRNHNSLGLRRGGFGITKLPKGISLTNGGFLFENLPDGIKRNNMGLQLTLTSQDSCKIQIKVQYQNHSLATYNSGSSYMLEVPKCKRKTFAVTFSRFPNIRYLDVKRIWIYGPVIVHKIKSAKKSLISQVLDTSPNLVDDLSSWPSNLASTNMIIDMPPSASADAELFHLNSNTPGSGLNSFNYRCIGEGVSITDGGIQLSNDGSVFEQLAMHNNFYDLNNTHLEIQYSVEYMIERTLVIYTVIPNDTDNHFHIEPVTFDLHFVPGKRRSVMIDVGNSGPSNAFHITGQGAVTLHRIQLHHWPHGRQTSLSPLVIDDFSDWPLMTKSNRILMVDPMNSATPINSEIPAMALNRVTKRVSSSGHATTLFDYQYINWHQMPLLQNCKYVEGLGVEISGRGSLIQPFAYFASLNMIITYSAMNLATRVIHFIFASNRCYFCCKKDMHVLFNSGQFQQVVIPIPDHYTDHYTDPYSEYFNGVVVLGMIIGGPILVHQVQLVEHAKPVDLLPGQSTTTALLIDDFSCWEDDPPQPNNLNHELFTLDSNGLGTVTLHSHDQYLIEDFLVIWKRYESTMVLQITYSIADEGLCLVSLIPESSDHMETGDPYNAVLPYYTKIGFDPGTRSKMQILLNVLVNVIPSQYHMFKGFVIHGPNAPNSLTIHRIEFMPIQAYVIPIIPKHDVPFHWTGLRIPTIVQVNDTSRTLLDMQMKDQPELRLEFERAYMWRDSYKILQLTPENLQMKFKIKFIGELGYDLGGLTREFFTLMAQEIKNSKHALFNSLKVANYALHINPNSYINPDHLDRFKIVGRIIGKAILSRNLLGIRLVPILYRKMIEKPSPSKNKLPDLIENDMEVPDISELKAIDPEVHNSLAWILKNNITEISKKYDWTMSLESDFFGKKIPVDLVKDGSLHKVTQQNKNQFVRENAKWYVIQRVEAQANALRDGVWDVVPQRHLAEFTESQLELIIAGTFTIDVKDWSDHTTYYFDNWSHSFLPNDPIVRQFWKCIQDWSLDKLAKLLRFSTGSPCLPGTGFKGLNPKFTIIPLPKTEFYPKSSTCFNLLKLPLYEDKKLLCKRLEEVIQVEQFDRT